LNRQLKMLDYEKFLLKLKKIKILITDVDGVWTPGTLGYIEGGEEIKYFHVHDGYGLKMLIENGIEVVVVSTRYSDAVQKRCRELGIQSVFQGIQNKEEILNKLLEKYTQEEIGVIGDDILDLPLFAKAGVKFTVANAVQTVKEKADYITAASGGAGALREIAELILSTRKD